MAPSRDSIWPSVASFAVTLGEVPAMTLYRNQNLRFDRFISIPAMFTSYPIDIHTHHLPAIAGEAIVSLSPHQFSPQPGHWYAVGIHPWDTDKLDILDEMALFKKCITHPQIIAIGEAGLDALRGASISQQRHYFITQAEVAEQQQKPLIIHLVKALDELLAIQRQLSPSVPWIIHGFRGKPQQAHQLLSRGFYLSYGLRFNPESLRITPTERLLIESDEELTTTEQLCETIAQARHQTSEEVRKSLDENVKKLFFNA